MGMYGSNDSGQPTQRSGIGRRLTFALLIAFVGWMVYMSQTEVNPVTGEKQHVTISPDQEIRLGLESAPTMAREMGGVLPSTDRRAIEVKKIGEILVMRSDASKSPWKFQFHLLADSKTINAFALPGGQIFITLGLLNQLKTEAQLAGVLGHEMGHVIERHTAEQMAKSQLGQMLIIAAGSTVGNGSYQTSQANAPAVIASLVNQMFQLRYSRGDESEADVWGLKLMEQAGYDPTAMLGVMEVLKAAGGGQNAPEIFQTHPNPDLRQRQIREYLQKKPPGPHLMQGKELKEVFSDSDDNEDRATILRWRLLN